MKPQSEKSIQKAIIKYLKSLDHCWWYNTGPQRFGGRSGVPDLLVVFHGVFFAFEVKSETGKPTKLQEIEMAKINKAGSIATIIKSVDDVKKIFFYITPNYLKSLKNKIIKK